MSNNELKPCDAYGRLPLAGRFPDTMGRYCTDPEKRGFNVCVAVMPIDFSNRTGGFCYQSALNNVTSTTWFRRNVLKNSDLFGEFPR